jgi:hypothetical protein
MLFDGFAFPVPMLGYRFLKRLVKVSDICASDRRHNPFI